eukprot:m.92737 g.92737  ORF g.92737 m.92737 type:complete len:318 (-) comp12366_c0_seq3:1173-2126(-)
MAGMYTRFPSMTSIRSSSVESSLNVISALLILYSAQIVLIVSSSRLVRGALLVMWSPPLSFLRKEIFGGDLLRRIPNPSNSCSISRLWPRGFAMSKQMKIRLQVRATAMTCRPRPLPSFAPSIIPGRSRSCTFAPLYRITPGTVVNVVNSYAAASEYTPARLVSKVDFPTEGNPTKPTRASPVFGTSNPSPLPPPEVFTEISSCLSLARRAFKRPRCFAVALFFCVLAISASISSIFSRTPMLLLLLFGCFPLLVPFLSSSVRIGEVVERNSHQRDESALVCIFAFPFLPLSTGVNFGHLSTPFHCGLRQKRLRECP